MGRISARIAAITRVGHPRRRRQGQGAQGGGRERHRLRRRRARLPDAAADRRGRGRGVPRAALPPLFADAGAARAPCRDRAQDQARLRRRLRGRTGAGHQRRQARGLQHVPGALRPGRRGAAARAVLDVVPGGASRSAAVCRSCSRRRRRPASASSIDQLDAAVTPRTKALLFVSPSNPTGAVYPPDEVEAIGRWALERGIWIVTDEIYEHLTYGGHVFSSMPGLVPELADTCVILNGVAKTYAMTGWRVGWMIGPRDVIAAATNLQSHSTSNVSNVAQAAALAAVSGDLDAVAEMRTAFARRGQDDVRDALGDPGRHRASNRRARSTASPRSRACSGARSPAGVPQTTLELCEVLLEQSLRWRSCRAKPSAPRATRGCSSPSATTTSARASAASPTRSKADRPPGTFGRGRAS